MSEQARGASAEAQRVGRRALAKVGVPRITDQQRVLVGLGLLTLAIAAGVAAYPDAVTVVALLVPMVVANISLGPRYLPGFVVFVLMTLTLLVPLHPDVTFRVAGSVLTMFVIGFFILLGSFRRSRLGVAGALGESMLVDLRDRLLRQGGVPELPHNWSMSAEVRSAGGTLFAGDFVVAVRREARLDVVVVDVSGKGEGAGTRALLLSGAMGGLLGALEPEEFLGAANGFLLRQEWEEGFATAVHLSVDLDSGEFAVWCAGHPPPAVRSAGSGRWSVLECQGPLLGLVEEAEFEVARGRLQRGDGILLYTDGLVETPQRDLTQGIDRMLGRAEALLRGDLSRGADRLVDALGSRQDDRALVLLTHR